MPLSKSEITRISGFYYTDKTLSYDVLNRDVKHFKSLVKKGLVTVTPVKGYPGISRVALVPEKLPADFVRPKVGIWQ